MRYWISIEQDPEPFALAMALEIHEEPYQASERASRVEGRIEGDAENVDAASAGVEESLHELPKHDSLADSTRSDEDDGPTNRPVSCQGGEMPEVGTPRPSALFIVDAPPRLPPWIVHGKPTLDLMKGDSSEVFIESYSSHLFCHIKNKPRKRVRSTFFFFLGEGGV